MVRSSAFPLNIHLTSALSQLFRFFVSFFVPPSSLTHAILEVVLYCLIMVKLSVDLNEPKDSSKTDKAAQNCRTLKSLTLEIHHGGWFTPTPSRSYIGGQVSSVNVVDIDDLGLDYGLHSLNVDADVLEMAKYVKDYKIILVYIEHGNSNVDTGIFVTLKKGVAIAVDNNLRKAPIEIDSSPDVNRNLTPMCHRILEKEWEQCAEDPFEELDDILGEYTHIGKQITGSEITRNESTGNESTVR
ncbi:hypothetical protein Tco_0053818, partial [Tanacetum coccineum]